MIFRSCTARDIESFINDTKSCPISRVYGHHYQVKPKEDVWYVAAGIFEAFQRITTCEYVVCARDDLCVIEIQRGNHTIVNIRRDMMGTLSRFYIQVLLPELAHPMRKMKYPLRDGPIKFDKAKIERIRRGDTPREE